MSKLVPLEMQPQWRELKAKIDAMTKERESLVNRLELARSGSNVEQEAQSLLLGKVFEVFDQAAAAHRVRVLDAAINLLKEKQFHLKDELSRDAVKQVLPDYKELTRERVRLTRALSEQITKQRLARESLQSAGYEANDLPIFWPHIVDELTNHDGETSRFLRDMSRCRLFDPSDKLFQI